MEQTVSKENRKEYIDIARGIAIILMAIGHLGLKNSLTQIIYSFHMPLFFVLSGMTIKHESDLRRYLNKRIKRLVVPYLLFALIFSNPEFTAWIYVLYGSRNSISLAGSSTPLWFLPCLFVADFIFQLLLRLHKYAGGGITKCFITFISTCVLAILGLLLSRVNVIRLGLPLSLDIALIALPFMCFGWLIGQKSDIKIKKSVLSVLLFGAVVLVFILYRYNLPISLTQGFNHVELSIGAVGIVPLFYFCALLGSFAVVAISFLIQKFYVLSEMGKNTLTCLGIHGVVIRIVRLASNEIGVNELIYGIGAVIVVICCTLVINRILRKYVPNMIGLN